MTTLYQHGTRFSHRGVWLGLWLLFLLAFQGFAWAASVTGSWQGSTSVVANDAYQLIRLRLQFNDNATLLTLGGLESGPLHGFVGSARQGATNWTVANAASQPGTVNTLHYNLVGSTLQLFFPTTFQPISGAFLDLDLYVDNLTVAGATAFTLTESDPNWTVAGMGQLTVLPGVPSILQVKATDDSLFTADYTYASPSIVAGVQWTQYAHAYDRLRNQILNATYVWTLTPSMAGTTQTGHRLQAAPTVARSYLLKVKATVGSDSVRMSNLPVTVVPNTFDHLDAVSTPPYSLVVDGPDSGIAVAVGKDVHGNLVTSLPAVIDTLISPLGIYTVNHSSTGPYFQYTLHPVSQGTATHQFTFSGGAQYPIPASSVSVGHSDIIHEIQVRTAASTAWDPSYVFPVDSVSADAPTHLYAYAYDRSHGLIGGVTFYWTVQPGNLQSSGFHFQQNIQTAGTYSVSVQAVIASGNLSLSGLNLRIVPGALVSIGFDNWPIPNPTLTLNSAGSNAISLSGWDAHGNRVTRLAADPSFSCTPNGLVTSTGVRQGPFFTFTLHPGSVGTCTVFYSLSGHSTAAMPVTVVSDNQLDEVLIRTADESNHSAGNLFSNGQFFAGDSLHFFAYGYDSQDNLIPTTIFSWIPDTQETLLPWGSNNHGFVGHLETAGSYDVEATGSAASSILSGGPRHIQIFPAALDSLNLVGTWPALDLRINGAPSSAIALVGSDRYGNPVQDLAEAGIVQVSYTPSTNPPFEIQGYVAGPYYVMTLRPLHVGSATATIRFGSISYVTSLVVVSTDGVINDVQIHATPSSAYQEPYAYEPLDLGAGEVFHRYAYAYDSQHNLLSGVAFTWTLNQAGEHLVSSGNHLFGEIQLAGSYALRLEAIRASSNSTRVLDGLAVHVRPAGLAQVVPLGQWPPLVMEVGGIPLADLALQGLDAFDNPVEDLTAPSDLDSSSVVALTGRTEENTYRFTLWPRGLGADTLSVTFSSDPQDVVYRVGPVQVLAGIGFQALNVSLDRPTGALEGDPFSLDGSYQSPFTLTGTVVDEDGNAVASGTPITLEMYGVRWPDGFIQPLRQWIETCGADGSIGFSDVFLASEGETNHIPGDYTLRLRNAAGLLLWQRSGSVRGVTAWMEEGHTTLVNDVFGNQKTVNLHIANWSALSVHATSCRASASFLAPDNFLNSLGNLVIPPGAEQVVPVTFQVDEETDGELALVWSLALAELSHSVPVDTVWVRVVAAYEPLVQNFRNATRVDQAPIFTRNRPCQWALNLELAVLDGIDDSFDILALEVDSLGIDFVPQPSPQIIPGGLLQLAGDGFVVGDLPTGHPVQARLRVNRMRGNAPAVLDTVFFHLLPQRVDDPLVLDLQSDGMAYSGAPIEHIGLRFRKRGAAQASMWVDSHFMDGVQCGFAQDQPVADESGLGYPGEPVLIQSYLDWQVIEFDLASPIHVPIHTVGRFPLELTGLDATQLLDDNGAVPELVVTDPNVFFLDVAGLDLSLEVDTTSGLRYRSPVLAEELSVMCSGSPLEAIRVPVRLPVTQWTLTDQDSVVYRGLRLALMRGEGIVGDEWRCDSTFGLSALEQADQHWLEFRPVARPGKLSDDAWGAGLEWRLWADSVRFHRDLAQGAVDVPGSCDGRWPAQLAAGASLSLVSLDPDPTGPEGWILTTADSLSVQLGVKVRSHDASLVQVPQTIVRVRLQNQWMPDQDLPSGPDSLVQTISLGIPNPFPEAGPNQVEAAAGHGTGISAFSVLVEGTEVPGWLGDSLAVFAPLEVYTPLGLTLEVSLQDAMGVPVTATLLGGQPYQVVAHLAWSGSEPLDGDSVSTLSLQGGQWLDPGTDTLQVVTRETRGLVWNVIARDSQGARSLSLTRQEFLGMFVPAVHPLLSDTITHFEPDEIALPPEQSWDSLTLLQPESGDLLLEVVTSQVSGEVAGHVLAGSHAFPVTVTNHDTGVDATTMTLVLERSLDAGVTWQLVQQVTDTSLAAGSALDRSFTQSLELSGEQAESQWVRMRIVQAAVLGNQVPEEQIGQAEPWFLTVDALRSLRLDLTASAPQSAEPLQGLVDGQSLVIRVVPQWQGTAPVESSTVELTAGTWFSQVDPAGPRTIPPSGQPLEWRVVLARQAENLTQVDLEQIMPRVVTIPLQPDFASEVQWSPLTVRPAVGLEELARQGISTLSTGQVFAGSWTVLATHLPADSTLAVTLLSTDPAVLAVDEGAIQRIPNGAEDQPLIIPFRLRALAPGAADIRMSVEVVEPHSGRLVRLATVFSVVVVDEPALLADWDWSSAWPPLCADSSVTEGQEFSLVARTRRIGDWTSADPLGAAVLRVRNTGASRFRLGLSRDGANQDSLDIRFEHLDEGVPVDTVRVFLRDDGSGALAAPTSQRLALHALQDWQWVLQGREESRGSIPTVLSGAETRFDILQRSHYRFSITPTLNGRLYSAIGTTPDTALVLPMTPELEQILRMRIQIERVDGSTPLQAGDCWLQLNGGQVMAFQEGWIDQSLVAIGASSPGDLTPREYNFHWVGLPVDPNTLEAIPLQEALRDEAASWSIWLDPQPNRIVEVNPQVEPGTLRVLGIRVRFSRSVVVDWSVLGENRAASLFQLTDDGQLGNVLGAATLDEYLASGVSTVDGLTIRSAGDSHLELVQEVDGVLRFPTRVLLRPDRTPGMLVDAAYGYDLLGGMADPYAADGPDYLRSLPEDIAIPTIAARWPAAPLVSRRTELPMRIDDLFPGLDLDSLQLELVSGGVAEPVELQIVETRAGAGDVPGRRAIYIRDVESTEANLIVLPGGLLYEAGQHSLRVRAMDLSRSRNVLIQELPFSILATVDVSEQWLAGPNPFDPRAGDLLLQYRLDAPPWDVRCLVLDVAGDLVTVIPLPAVQDGTAAWDGRNQSGQDVANGPYLLILQAQTPAGEVRRIFKLALVRQGGIR
jgi:hypothetical protein